MAKLLVSIGLIPRMPDIVPTPNAPPPGKEPLVEERRRHEFDSAGDWWTGTGSGDYGRVNRAVNRGVYDWGGVTIVAEDTAMFVGVFSSIAEQIIKSA